MTISTSPGFTGWPAATRISFTVPATCALNSFSIFMASSTMSPSPAATDCPTETWMTVTLPGIGAFRPCPGRARAAPGVAEDVARLLLDPDRVALAADVHRAGAVLIRHLRHVGGAVEQDGPDALAAAARVHREGRAVEDDGVAPRLPGHLDRGDRPAGLGHELHRSLQPGRSACSHA